ncbi:unnamed protein product [Larinioides sclopetarius]|uniref:Secreted protein n=1 Tax=Larinioides sclopetarius TaxID=280406 RepID=A0AAV2BVA2_9ARAC
MFLRPFSCRVPLCSSGCDSCLSPRRPGLDSRYGKCRFLCLMSPTSSLSLVVSTTMKIKHEMSSLYFLSADAPTRRLYSDCRSAMQCPCRCERRAV